MECTHKQLWTNGTSYSLNQLLISFQMSYTGSAKLTGEPSWFNDFPLLLLFPGQPGGWIWLSPLIHWCRVLRWEPCALGAVWGRRACSDPRWCRCDPGIRWRLCDTPATPSGTWQCQCDPAVPAKHKAGAKALIRTEHKDSTLNPLAWKIQVT